MQFYVIYCNKEVGRFSTPIHLTRKFLKKSQTNRCGDFNKTRLDFCYYTCKVVAGEKDRLVYALVVVEVADDTVCSENRIIYIMSS